MKKTSKRKLIIESNGIRVFEDEIIEMKVEIDKVNKTRTIKKTKYFLKNNSIVFRYEIGEVGKEARIGLSKFKGSSNGLKIVPSDVLLFAIEQLARQRAFGYENLEISAMTRESFTYEIKDVKGFLLQSHFTTHSKDILLIKLANKMIYGVVRFYSNEYLLFQIDINNGVQVSMIPKTKMIDSDFMKQFKYFSVIGRINVDFNSYNCNNYILIIKNFYGGLND